MNALKGLLGIGVAVGLLAGAWTQLSVELELVTWVAFLAWACFFAAGGGLRGAGLGAAANLTGVFWAWVVSEAVAQVTGQYTLALAVMVLGLVLCLQAAVPLLSFIPGAFVGAAALFGTAFDLWPTVVALVAGSLLGLASEWVGGQIQRVVDGPQQALPVSQTV